MRRVRYSVAMSLDGYIAGPNGEADWIVMDPEIGAGFADYYKQFDTFLIGRKTYTAMTKPGKGGGGGAFAGFKIIVVSRTLNPRDYPKATIISAGVKEAITALKQEPGKDIWLFGGGELFRSLLDLGLVDTVEVGVIPVLLGGGIPFLPPPASRAALTLVSHRAYQKTGTLWLDYAVTPPRRRKRRT
ncbi:MAG TPA: dihydrofolate reductase family protein [Vicinamibacterales bacterium]|nr:dihydrofolate reductase family protein [Vicinamibacterales bacterium]